MEFQFAKYTEVTDLVFQMFPEKTEEGYLRFFICPDVHDFWVCRILKGYGEDYEENENSYVLERNRISMWRKFDEYPLSAIRRALTEDNEDGGNYDYKTSYDIDELIEMVDGGYGILNLKDADVNAE